MNKKRGSEPKQKPSLGERLLRAMDVPVGVLGNTSFIEATGNRELEISGCIGLEVYTSERVVLELCDGAITIDGDRLELRSFSGGAVAVSGTIRNIFFGKKSGSDIL